MNADVVNSHPEILTAVSDHLFGQLEGFLDSESSAIARRWEESKTTVEEREKLLGEFLCFLNTLSATHEVVRAFIASELWFSTLLKIVDVDSETGGLL